MRILVVSQYYPPEPVTFCHQFALEATKLGHQVSVVTSFPSYPAGRIYEGYRQRLIRDEVIDGIPVARIPQFPDHSASAFRRVTNYASFMSGVMTLGNLRFHKADAVLVYQSAILTGLGASFLAKLHGAPVVYYVSDLWPESVMSSSMMGNKAAMGTLRWLCKRVYRAADYSFCNTNGYVESLKGQGVKPDRLEVMYYWPQAYEGIHETVSDIGNIVPDDGKFRVVFIGTMGPSQALDAVIAAADLLKDRPNLEFLMVGDGVEYPRLVEKAAALKLANVRFTGRLNPAVSQAVMARANALLVHLKTDALSRVSIPSKTFSYMKAGRPILMAVEGEAAKFVAEHGVGVAAKPSDPASIADAVVRLMQTDPAQLREMGERGMKAYGELCSAKLGAARICAVMEELKKR
jgi:glycosyltransferase involved in cell wall biosynthesis